MIKKKQALTPKSKIVEMANDPNQKVELIKKHYLAILFRGKFWIKSLRQTKKKPALNRFSPVH